MVIHANKYYLFKGNRTRENLENFLKIGYKSAQASMIKPPKGMLGKLSFLITLNIESLVATLDRLGLAFLPRNAKLFAILIFLFSPIIAVLICMWLTKEPTSDDSKPEAKKEGKAETVAKEKKD